MVQGKDDGYYLSIKLFNFQMDDAKFEIFCFFSGIVKIFLYILLTYCYTIYLKLLFNDASEGQ